MKAADLAVVHRPEEARYELLLEGRPVGELVYSDRGDHTLAFVHTGVDPALRGKGLGSALVAGAYADAHERGMRVVPLCPFVVEYVRRHPGADSR